MGKLKVLYIAKNIPTPGKKTNRVIFDIAKNLSSFCNIQFLFPKEIVPFWLKNNPRFSYLYKLKKWNFEGFEIKPISYIKLPFNHFQYWTLCYLPWKAKKLVKKEKYTLVHAHYLFPDGYIAYRIYKKYAIPYVITFRNQDKQYLELISPKNVDYNKAKRILNNARKVITTNGAYKDFVEEQFQLNTEIVPHGINPSILSIKTVQKQKDSVVITTVAAAIKRKNIDWIIEATRNYTGNKKIELRIIGDGKELNTLKKLAKKNKNIAFLGRLPHEDVLQELRNSDIFALPSYNETFGMVYLEAAASHSAIIGFKGEGVWGVFNESEEMLFCINYEDFEEKLHGLIENRNLRIRLTQNAFEKAKTMEWGNIRNRYAHIYENSISVASCLK